MLNRRQFLSLTGAAAVAMTQSAATGSRRQTASRPNILFCIFDDQTWLHCSSYGSRMVHTPHFGRVAREGVLFSNAFVSVPSCNPSRASVLTDMPFYRLKEASMNHTPWPRGLAVYTDMLSAKGYHVGFTGKGAGPTDFRAYLCNHRQDGPYCFDLAFGKRPAEELYDVKKDPYQLRNLADQDQYAGVKADLAERLSKDLVQTKDPRSIGRGDELDSYARMYQKSLAHTVEG